jgi:cytochrome c oxidase subunit II
MNRKRIGLCAALAVALLLAATEPVLAQSSVNEGLISGLNEKLLWVAVPITVLVEGILIYTVWKYRNNDNPTPTRENRRLEITWTVATAVILLFVGLGSFLVMGSPYVAPSDDGVQAQQQIQPAVTQPDVSGAIAPTEPDAAQVEIRAYQWGWTFNYPDDNVTSSGTLVVPANTEVYLHVISDDVLHAVHVPALGLKQDTIPGQYDTIQTNISQTGSFQLYCAEYCGSGHSRMLANMTVLPQNEYQSWLQEQRSSGNALNSGSSGDSSGNSSSGNSSAGNATESDISVAPVPARAN